MDKYTFHNLYEEIKNESDEQLLADFYDHWGHPFSEVMGFNENSVENPKLRKELKEKTKRKQWQDKRDKKIEEMLNESNAQDDST